MGMRPANRPRSDHEAVGLPILGELMAGIELGFLWMSPVFLGYGVPQGDGSAVVLVPGFLGTDLSLSQLRIWLKRIGYRPYYSGISFNAECPNLLIRQHLRAVIQQASDCTKGRVHVIGHSLGGTMARAVAAQMPERVASVITLGSPIRRVAGHAALLRVAEIVRKGILDRHGCDVLPDCYTANCTCSFLQSLAGNLPKSVRLTAVYSKCDGMMDWHACRTGDPDADVEVSATHIGLVFSPLAYKVMAERLAGCSSPRQRAGKLILPGRVPCDHSEVAQGR